MKKSDKKQSLPSDDIEAFENWDNIDSDKADPPAHNKEVSHDSPISDELIGLSADVPVHVVAVIGRTTISVKDLMNCQMGQVIDLGRPPGETVDIVASGKLFARGELVDIDGKLGVRIVKVIR